MDDHTTESRSLKIVRSFNAAPEIIFDAFTKPEAMAVWWTDDTEFDIDLRVGGSKLTFVQSGKDIAAELRELPEGAISESEKGWQQGFDLMEDAWGE